MVNMHSKVTRSTAQKISLFRRCFTGRLDVYGTYDIATGRARQVKQAVTDLVFLAHLQGKQPYGVYLLVGDRTRAVVADFDVDDLEPPMEFIASAERYGLAAYIERSKSKGFHVWMLLDEIGESAAKARLVVRHILEEMGQPNTEVFPKHDRLDTRTMYGNYIYAPLFGALVPKARTVFLDPRHSLTPSPDQWQFLEEVVRVKEEQLDEIIEINELDRVHLPKQPPTSPSQAQRLSTFGLPPCAQRMLTEGVTSNQRVSSFRLAVQLKRVGIPHDLAVVALTAWAQKNKPARGERIITAPEIRTQTASAYGGNYRSCGCEDEAVKPFCDEACPIHRKNTSQ